MCESSQHILVGMINVVRVGFGSEKGRRLNGEAAAGMADDEECRTRQMKVN